MKLLRSSLAAFAAVCIASAVFAADASGTWTFAGGFGGRGGGGGGAGKDGAPAPTNTLVLTAKDGKLTGKLTPPGRGGAAGEPIEIKNGTVTGDTVTFSVERPGRDGGAPRVTKYTGKLEGDTITGKAEGPGRGGEVQSLDWVAKRSK